MKHNLLYYIYDGTFEGLLTALSRALQSEQQPDDILPDDANRDNLFADYVFIETDMEISSSFELAIKRDISAQAFDDVVRCYLSEAPDSGSLILNFVKLGLKAGRDIRLYRADKAVYSFNETVDRVKKEAYRMLGLVRFRSVEDDIYYAEIEPDYNIIFLIAQHFVRRFSRQKFVIHDLKRKLAAVYDGRAVEVRSVGLDRKPEETDMEKFYSSLWRDFFNNIAIQERKNPALQRQFMPRRYWKHLTEKQGAS